MTASLIVSTWFHVFDKTHIVRPVEVEQVEPVAHFSRHSGEDGGTIH